MAMDDTEDLKIALTLIIGSENIFFFHFSGQNAKFVYIILDFIIKSRDASQFIF